MDFPASAARQSALQAGGLLRFARFAVTMVTNAVVCAESGRARRWRLAPMAFALPRPAAGVSLAINFRRQ